MPPNSTSIPPFLEPYVDLAIDISLALLIFVIGWIVSKSIHGLTLRFIRSRKVEESLARFAASLARYLIFAVAIITALGQVGVETTSLVALLGTVGLAIGLALQGSLAHFAAGTMILFFRPFVLDDFVTAGGHSGFVKDIGLFATELRTHDNEKIIIPNGTITSGPIVNHTARGTRRGQIKIGVAYGTDLTQVQQVLGRAAASADRVLKDPAPNVFFAGFGGSSIDFIVMPWCVSDDYLDMLHNVRLRIYEELNTAGIEIPFSQIVVHTADAPVPK